MMIGFLVGAIRMILDFSYKEPRCGEEDMRPSIVSKLHYMYFAMLLFWITGISVVVISLFTRPHPGGNVSSFCLVVLHCVCFIYLHFFKYVFCMCHML